VKIASNFDIAKNSSIIVEFENSTHQSVTKLSHSFDRIIQDFIIENEKSDSFAKNLNSYFDDFHTP